MSLAKAQTTPASPSVETQINSVEACRQTLDTLLVSNEIMLPPATTAKADSEVPGDSQSDSQSPGEIINTPLTLGAESQEARAESQEARAGHTRAGVAESPSPRCEAINHPALPHLSADSCGGGREYEFSDDNMGFSEDGLSEEDEDKGEGADYGDLPSKERGDRLAAQRVGIRWSDTHGARCAAWEAEKQRSANKFLNRASERHSMPLPATLKESLRKEHIMLFGNTRRNRTPYSSSRPGSPPLGLGTRAKSMKIVSPEGTFDFFEPHCETSEDDEVAVKSMLGVRTPKSLRSKRFQQTMTTFPETDADGDGSITS